MIEYSDPISVKNRQSGCHDATRVIVFIQARMSSSRLPGKSLKPINGIPLAVLAALRAGNGGREVVVLTSMESSDDNLEKMLDIYEIPCFRGDLENVLDRYVSAGRYFGLEGGDVIIRLTADNLLPDGCLINELVEALCLGRGKVDYIGANYPEDGLPYGVNAEAFYYSDLEEAARCALSKYDLEHVTPWIKNTKRILGLSSLKSISGKYDMADLRLTIDTPLDYKNLCEIFEIIDDNVNTPWWEVCDLAKVMLSDGSRRG